MDGGLVSDASLAKIRSDVVDQGKRVIFVGGTCWQPFASAVNQHLVLNNVNDYCWKVSDTPHWTLTDPDHGLADGLPDTYNFANSSAAHYALRATDPDIEVVGVNGDFYHNLFYKNVAFPTAGGNPTQGGDLIWLINSAYENYWTIQADFDLLKQVIENALTYTGAMVDVPWMWQEPITGTVPAGSVLPVDVWFTTVVTDPLPLGTYTATLRVRGNDPVQRTQDVLVRMHIIEDYVAPIPSFTSNSPVMVHEEVVFTNTTIPGIPPETTYLWDFGDGMTSTLEHPTHIYHSYGWYTVTLEACNAQLCAEYADMVEILPLEIWLPILLRNF